QTTATIPVTVYGDTEYEPTEGIHIQLTSATGAVIVTTGAEGQRLGYHYLWLTNDDPASAAVAPLGPYIGPEFDSLNSRKGDV
ncbi:MAG: hypothetical protein U1C73_05380, partial [Dietzia sp.]|nr:hypothetical protein [Dietzia sp.]